ncbi:cell wall elongation regulator TseB-like domain-containing protein [Gracilibacillus sp. D59]|uniref:cell wall elongation regulator TseB-like domain-containing protein n=1 Tax=Gracilibacillus sp. D59 TaxID=3457434 RepID=UPI003FCCBC09
MKKQSLPFIGRNKLWIIVSFCMVVLLITLYYFITLYQDIMNSKTEHFDDVKTLAIENTSLDVIHSIERFHGEQLYYVLEGETNDNQASLLYMYQSEEKWEYDIYDKESLYSEDILLSEWRDRCTSCELLGSTIGIDNDLPILEIKYINTSDRLVYEHVLLKDKSHYRLTLNPSFQE